MHRFSMVKFKGVGETGGVTFLSSEQLDADGLAKLLGEAIAENDKDESGVSWVVVVTDGALRTFDFDIQIDELESARQWVSDYPYWFRAAVNVAESLV